MSADKPNRGILKTLLPETPNLGEYNLYTKRASFKENVVFQEFVPEASDELDRKHPEASSSQDQPEEEEEVGKEDRQHHTEIVHEEILPIISLDEDLTSLSAEELLRRKEFEHLRKLRAKEGAESLDLKAVLGHKVEFPEDEDEIIKDIQDIQVKITPNRDE